MKRKPADLTLRETLRWEPQSGFQRIDQHMRRLLRSADALGFRAPANAVQVLEKKVGGESPLCVKLVMNYKGELDIETADFRPLQEGTVWRIRIATQTRLDSTDTFYRHKSSRREPYDAARAEFSAGDADEVLLLNERGELCEGSSTMPYTVRRTSPRSSATCSPAGKPGSPNRRFPSTSTPTTAT